MNKQKAFAPESITVFNESNFYKSFLDDVRNAKALVILQSPYISLKRWLQLSSDFRACIDRNVCVCIFLQDQGDCAEFQNCISHLQSAHIHVNIRPSVHEKLAIIDAGILWDGSLNILSHSNTRERMTRTVSKEMAVRALIDHRVNQCDTCIGTRGQAALDGNAAIAKEQLELIGSAVLRQRLELGISQREIALRAGVSQQTVSDIERGRFNVSISMLCAVCHQLKLELRPVPWFYLPALDLRRKIDG